MTQIQISNNAEKNYELLSPILDSLRNINIQLLKGRLQRGLLLKKIKEQKLYIGHDGWISTWAEFTDSISLSVETARQDIEIYNQFFKFLEEKPLLYNQIPYERLVRLLPVVKDTSEDISIINYLDMAANSNRVDFDNNIREAKGKIATDSCKHDYSIVFLKCSICGHMIKKDV
tara:strand:- start:3839 stop:4360 length:522 start_codon:yes stop_codon:yes gene_type:complete